MEEYWFTGAGGDRVHGFLYYPAGYDPAKTYPLVQLDISNASHPFFTGQMKIIDSAGRVERFNKRYGTRKKAVTKKEPVQK